MYRCGSPARTAWPVVVRVPATSQPLLPAVPGPSREGVPGQGPGTEEGGRGALRAMPFDLQLPGTVAGGDPALGAGEFTRAARAEMGDPPGVAVDLDAHPRTSFPLS